jgi:hypothetical protein
MPLFLLNSAQLNQPNAGDLTWSGAAWTAYTPTFTPTGGSGVTFSSSSGSYKVMGKTVTFTLIFLINFTIAPSSVTMSIHGGLTPINATALQGANISGAVSLPAYINGTMVVVTSTNVASGNYIVVSGTFQAN